MTNLRFYRPITQSEYFAQITNDTFTKDLECVVGDDLIEFLATHRDQGVWFNVLMGQNYDLDSSYDVADWIVAQDDCDVMIAICAFGAFGGPSYCGSSDQLNPPPKGLTTLSKKAAERPYAENKLDPEGFNGLELLATARSALAELKAKDSHAEPVIAIPEELLSTPLMGTTPQVNYMIGEEGLWLIPRSLN